MTKTAVVLFNLGGPDSLEAVRPFLFNLFFDPAIIDRPKPLRWFLARLISSRRAPIAREIYKELGGSSPLLANSLAQAEALEKELNHRWDSGARRARTFVAMRYWHPRSDEIARAVRDYAPDELVLLPLYPQYSTTTSGSSLADWHRAAAGLSLPKPAKAMCCYPDQPGLIAEIAERLGAALAAADDSMDESRRPRVLFSAHGLPRKIIEAGDPYQWQVERTAAAIVEALKDRPTGRNALDWVVCYQSRVGPLEWIGPYTDAEITRAGRDGVPVIVVPIAFVSEHSETLVELDVEYRRLAEAQGVPSYVRVPTVGTSPSFIRGLADLVTTSLEADAAICSSAGGRICPAGARRCALSPK